MLRTVGERRREGRKEEGRKEENRKEISREKCEYKLSYSRIFG